MNGLPLKALAAWGVLATVLLFACLQKAEAGECYPLTVGRVIDGDNICMVNAVPCPPSQNVRLTPSGPGWLDAPEIRDTCDKEIMLGHIAKQNLELLVTRKGVDVRYCPTGEYTFGRPVATVWADGRDASEALITDGHAMRWIDKKHNWCEVP